MEENRTIMLDGFAFELTGFFCADGTTTMTVCVSGNGQSPCDLKGWVCEICPGDAQAFEEINILSCEKRRRQSSWVPAVAQKTTYELTGDIGISGIIISDWVGRYADDPDVEFRIVFDAEFKPKPFRLGVMRGESIHISDSTIRMSIVPKNKVWADPIEKSFCLFLAVPDGFKPDNASTVCVSATKRMLHICCEPNTMQNAKPLNAKLCGSVRIMASVPLKCKNEGGSCAHTAACDCFDVCDSLGFADEEGAFGLCDINIKIQKESLDLTLLNAHSGKSLYRLDGQYVIEPVED